MHVSRHFAVLIQDSIQAIWSAHRLGAVTQVSRPPGGVCNLCFIVNNGFVLRLDPRDSESHKFHDERVAYSLLAQRALPVPQVLVLDDSDVVVPFDYMITTRLPGRTLASGWQSLAVEQLQALVYEIGQCLARVHGCTLPAYGKLHALDYASWAGYVREHVEPYLQSASEERLLNPPLRAAIERLLDREMGNLEMAQPALIHCDFHYANVLHVDGRLSGIFDFEWALAGDPAYDLSIGQVRERMVPGSEAALLAGYRSVRPNDPSCPRRVRCYQMIQRLEHAVTCKRSGDDEGAAAALRRLRSLVEPIGL